MRHLTIVVIVALFLLSFPASEGALNEWTQLFADDALATGRPSRRDGVASVLTSDARMFLFGGGATSSSEVWEYGVDGATPGTWTEHAPTLSSSLTSLPAASKGHGAVLNGDAMAVTGHNGEQVDILDLTTLVWRRGHNSRFAATDFAWAYDPDTYPLAMQTGGRSPLGVAIDSLYSYDPLSDTGPLGDQPWSFVDRPADDPWMERRFSHASVWCNGTLFTFGGKVFGTHEPMRDLWRYTPATNTMTLIFNPLSDIPNVRAGHNLFCADTFLYVFAGVDDTTTPLYHNDIWRFSFATESWTEVTPIGTPPSPRAFASCVRATLHFICFGGADDAHAYNDLWAFQYTVLGPAITSVVASDPDNLDDSYGSADQILITFAEPTSMPPAETKEDLDALFAFSTALGADYRGQWLSTSLLAITVVDPTGALGAASPVIGAWTMTVRATGNLRNADLLSLPSESTSPLLTGNWGVPPGPAIGVFLADDPDDADGILSDGDALIVIFNTTTNEPPVATKAEIDAVISFSASLGADYTGEWTDAATLRITLVNTAGATLEIGTTRATCFAGLRNAAETSQECASISPPLRGDWGRLAGPRVLVLLADDPDDGDGIHSVGDTLTLVFDQDTNQPPAATTAAVNDLLAFSEPIGTDYTGVWLSPSRLMLTITDTTAALASIDDLAFTVTLGATPGTLRNAAATSLPATGVSPVVTGDWGQYPGPTVVSWTANDPDDADALYGAADTVTIVFDHDTNQPAVATTADIQTLLAFAPPLGAEMTGIWDSPSTLVITIVTATTATPAPAIGTATFRVLPEGDLRTVSPISAPSNATSPALAGDWGLLAGPVIASFVADDPDDADAIFGAQDTLTLTFVPAPQNPVLNSRTLVDAYLTFNRSLGTDYRGAWADVFTLVVTVVDATGSTVTPGTTLGLGVQVTGDLRNAAGTSLPSRAKAGPPSGDWGLLAGPLIVSVTADDPDDADGYYSAGDTITVVFAESTNTPPVASKADLDALLAWTHALGDDYTGQWTSFSSLRITIVSAANAGPPVIGTTTARVLAAGGLRNRAETSLPSVAQSPAVTGDWGTGPTCDFGSCGACSGAPGCGWCAATETCQVGDSGGPHFGSCPVWQFSECVACNSSSCAACLNVDGCGWCATAGSPSNSYACVFGDHSGPYAVTGVSCGGSSVWHHGTCPWVVTEAVAGAETTEAGGQASVRVALSEAPLRSVIVTVASSDTTEGTAGAAFLLFDPGTWNTPQTVTVTGVDDAVDDGDQAYALRLGPLVSEDLTFHGVEGSPLSLVNIDDDTAALVVSSTGTPTEEATLVGTPIAVRLATEPVGTVTVSLVVSDPTEAVVDPTTLTFGPGDWSTPKIATATGVDDPIDDGDIPYFVNVSATAAAGGYAALQGPAVALVNLDDDLAGIVMGAFSASTTEGGGRALFTVVLTAAPQAALASFPIVSSDTTEVAIAAGDPVLLTFTPDNWSVPQTATLTGVDDDQADGDQTATITVGPAVTSDPLYATISASRALTNIDNDRVEIRVSGPAGTVSELGTSTTIGVTLGSRPAAPVVIPVASDDTTEGVVSPAWVVLGPGNWSTPAVVTVTGVDDLVTDGTQVFGVHLGPSVSSDGGYHGLSAAPVSVSCEDNDIPGLTVSPVSGLTSESGTTATFSVGLLAAPTASVTVTVTVSDATEARLVGAATHTFAVATWADLQMFTVAGVDDNLDDGDQPYAVRIVASSADAAYAGLVAWANNTNVDDDAVGLRITAGSAPTFETSEVPGATATIEVRLATIPADTVTVTAVSLDTTEGQVVAPGSVTIAPIDWDSPHMIVVAGVDDAIDDGDVAYLVRFTTSSVGDPTYAGLTTEQAMLNRDDADTASVVLSGLSSLTTSEAGGETWWTVTLGSQPDFASALSRVTVPMTVSPGSEAVLSVSHLYFTMSDWNVPQTVTARGLDDDVDDGDTPVNCTVGPTVASLDPRYQGLTAGPLTWVNLDDGDTAGIVVSGTGVPYTRTWEDPTQPRATFAVALATRPLYDVVVTLRTSDPTEGLLVAPDGSTQESLSWTVVPVQWATPVTVQVAGVDDEIADLDTHYTIDFAPAVSADAKYMGLRAAANVSMLNVNDDAAGVLLSVVDGVLGEASAGALERTVLVRLLSEPAALVAVPVWVDATDEAVMLYGGSVTSSAVVMTFTDADWTVPQAVSVRSYDDALYDGAQPIYVAYGPTVSGDPVYASRAGNTTLWNTDDEQAALVLVNDPPELGDTSEDGTQVSVAVLRLSSEPRATVRVPVSVYSANPTTGLPEVTATPSALVFGPGNWETPQTVTLRGEDDSELDGDQTAVVFFGGAISSDDHYAGRFLGPYTITNHDDDLLGLKVSVAAVAVHEAVLSPVHTATVEVSLGARPEGGGDVVVGVSVSHPGEATVSPAELTFTGSLWHVPQMITVTGVDDLIEDGLSAWTLTVGPVRAPTDSRYDGLAGHAVAGYTLDDETTASAQAYVAAPGETSELGAAAVVWVVPSDAPFAPVTVSTVSEDPTEGQVAQGSEVVFAGGAGVPLVPAAVRVAGVDDAEADGDTAYTVAVSASTAPDAVTRVTLVNVDDGDHAGLVLELVREEGSTAPLTTVTVNEAGTADVVRVQLLSQPRAQVHVPLTALGEAGVVLGEGELSFTPAQLVFDAATWAIPQTVVVRGVQDNVEDGDVSFTLTAGPASSNDAAYAGVESAALAGINYDVIPPEIESLSPSVLPLEGGEVLVEGRGFSPGLEVWVGEMRVGASEVLGACVDGFSGAVTVFSATRVLVDAPAQAAEGMYTLRIRNPDGAEAAYDDLFYSPNCPWEGTLGLGDTCTGCPGGAVCPGGNRIIPVAGYWNPGQSSGQVSRCVPKERCLGGLGSPCAPGYEGAFCGGCATAHRVDGILCEPCESRAGVAARWLILVAVWVLFTVGGVVLSDPMHAHMVWLCLGVGLIRVAGAAAGPRVPLFARTFSGLFAVVLGDFEFVHSGCASELPPNFTTTYFGTLLLLCVVAAVQAGVLGGMWAVDWRGYGVHYGRRLVRCLLGFAMVGYWAFAKITLQGVGCVRQQGRLYLMAEMAQRCFSGSHHAIATFAIPSLLVVAAVPLVVGVAFRQRQSKLDRDEVRARFGVLYELCELEWMWCALWFLGGVCALAIGAFVFVRQPVLQFVVMEVAVLVLIGVVMHRPFEHTWQNLCMGGLLGAGLLSICVSFVAWEGFDVAQSVVDGLAFLSVCVSACAVCAYLGALIWWGWGAVRGGEWGLVNRIAFAQQQRTTDNAQSDASVREHDVVIAFSGGAVEEGGEAWQAFQKGLPPLGTPQPAPGDGDGVEEEDGAWTSSSLGSHGNRDGAHGDDSLVVNRGYDGGEDEGGEYVYEYYDDDDQQDEQGVAGVLDFGDEHGPPLPPLPIQGRGELDIVATNRVLKREVGQPPSQ